MQVLARFTEEMAGCESIKDFEMLFSRCAKELGYSGFDAFSLKTGSIDNAYQPDNLFLCDYAPQIAWEYVRDGWLQMDPSFFQLARTSTPFDYVAYLRDVQPNASVIWQLSMLRLRNVRRAWLIPLSIFEYTRGVTLYMAGAREEHARRFEATRHEAHLISAAFMDAVFALHSAKGAGDVRKAIEDDEPVITAREADCLHWVARGKTNREVADILSVSENTVRFHMKNAFQKLGAHSRASAVSEAARRGVIQL